MATAHYRVRTCSPLAGPQGDEILTQAAERTGGQLHTQSAVLPRLVDRARFKSIFDDFRQSYVLRYSPSGVEGPGWHGNHRPRAGGEGRPRSARVRATTAR